MHIEHVTLYNKRADGGTVQSSFGFDRSALKAAREMGLTQFIDNCSICAPRWGFVGKVVKVT